MSEDKTLYREESIYLIFAENPSKYFVYIHMYSINFSTLPHMILEQN